uniref:G-protein coupled receptors family 1 profile domain-containing protein n=1 Tax=Plectus sambesii TaxID=2011161 RepID=A0A914WAJ7_9BILA
MGNSSYPEPWENILAAATISIFSAPSLILYILIVQVLIQNPRVFSKNPYYTLLSSLAVSDTTMLVLYLFYAVPCTLARCHIFGAGFDVAIGVVFNTAYFAGISCIALIAINRYWAVCRFINYDRTFSRRNVKILICFAWTAGGVSGAFQAFPCCHLRYSFTAYSWLYDMTQFGNAYYVWLDRGLNLTVFAVLAICYTAILYARFGSSTQAYLSCNQQSRRKFAERSLALQFGIIVLVLFVAGLSFTIIPELSQNHWLMLLVLNFLENASP